MSATRGEPRNDLPGDLKLFGTQLREIQKDAGNVGARSGERLSISHRDRIALQIDCDNGDRLGRLHRGSDGDGSSREDDLDPTADQLYRQRGEPSRHVASVLLHNQHFVTAAIAGLAKPLLEHLEQRGINRVATEDTDSRRLAHRLSVPSERRGEEAERDAGDEGPPVHYSIT